MASGKAERSVGSPALHLKLLGGFNLSLAGNAVTTIDAPKLQSLLAYLVLHREVDQPRARLAFLFWPESTHSQARTNLRRSLHHLRQGLPESERFLESEARAIRWRGGSSATSDVEQFEALIAQAQRAHERDERDGEREALEDAVTLYGGDLLPDCYDDWIVPERERLHDLWLVAAERIAELLEGERDYRAAIGFARRLHDSDPLNEGFCQRLMRLHALAADRASALRVYHGFATALARETGVEPGAAIREAHQQLLDPSGAAPPEKSADTGGARASPLVGRDSEWPVLCAAWERAAAGESLLAVISGEAGIGKSRLCEELVGWVARQGPSTASSRCYSAAGGLAYAPIAELLRSRALGPRVRQLGASWLTELARLLPELLDEHPGLSAPAPLTDNWQRTRLLDAVSRAVLADKRPVLLAIDDLQWCDVETLDWLHYLLRSRPTAPLLVAATARSEELGADHPAQSLLRAARSTGQVVELELAALGYDDTIALAASVHDSELGADQEQLVFRETEGHPLLVVEWMRSGLVDHSAPRPQRADSGAIALTPRAQAVIEARLAQLSPPAQELASLAATVGRAFRFDLLTSASSQGEEAVVEALDELWERRIVRERGVDAYDFSHDKLREVAYRRAGTARRRMLHKRVAQAMERLHAADLSSVSSDLADHYEKAGWMDRAISFYARAADVALRVHANERAIALYSRALALLEGERATAQRDLRELRLLTALGAPVVAVEGYGAPAVRDVYTRALELCERLGTSPDPPVLRALAILHLAVGELDRAFELGERLLERGQGEQDSMVRVEGHYVLGVTSFWLGDFATARGQLEKAIAEYVPDRARAHLALYSQDPRIVCMSRLAHVLGYLGEFEAAEETASEALRLAHELEHPFSLAYALHFTSVLAIDLGDEASARERALQLIELTEEQRLGFLAPMGEILRGWMLAADGHTDEAIGQIREGIGQYAESGWSLLQPQGLVLLARVCLDADRKGDAKAAVAEAIELTGRIGQHSLDAELHLLTGELTLAERRAPALAERQFTTALEVAGRQGAAAVAQRAADSLERLRAATG